MTGKNVDLSNSTFLTGFDHSLDHITDINKVIFAVNQNRLLIGTDYTLEDLNSYTPYQTDSVIVFFMGSGFDGSRGITNQQTTYNTYDYSSSISYQIRPTIRSKTSLGIQYYTNQLTSVAASGSKFPTPGLSTITATGVKDIIRI